MDRELMRCMLPERPPVGYEDWILREAKEDLRLDFLLYSAERVKVYPQLKAYMEPKDFEPIKSIWQTRCTCTACGEDFVTHHIKNGFTLYSGPDGCLYPVDPVNFDPCDCDAEDYGYDCQFVELSDNDTIACPMCDSEVSVIHSSRMHSRTRNALGCSVQNIGSYTAIIFWLTAHRIDRYGFSSFETYPRDAYVIGEKGGITRYRHTAGSASSFSAEHRTEDWRLANSTTDSSVILYHNWGSINNRMAGAHVWKRVPCLGGCTGEKTGVDEYIRGGGQYPVTYLKIWKKHRNIENLVKAGFVSLIEKNITRHNDSDTRILSTTVKGIDFKKNKPHEMLHMSKEDFRSICQKPTVWYPDKFEDWVEYKKIGGSCSAPEFDQYYGQFGYEGVGALFDLLRIDPKADFPKVSAYLAKQNVSPHQTRMLVDAREMAEALHPERGLTEEERWPRHLMAVHDRLDQQIQLEGDPKKNRELDAGFRAVVEAYGCLEWNDGDLRILLPRRNTDLIREGHVLRHCVGGYGKQHCDGKLIFFVRKYRRPERSYYTLNIDMTSGQPKQIQLHGYGNERHGPNKEYRHKIPQKVRDFVERWKKEVLMPWWLQQIHTDKKERTA